MRTALVINPMSADGTTGRDWEHLREGILAHFPDAEERFTHTKGDATRVTREALADGADLVLGIGGDGTNNEVVNGFFDPEGRPVREGAAFGFLPRGTGCDLARFLGIPRDVAAASALLAESPTWPLDVGLLELTGPDGAPVRKIFLNIMDFGIGGMISSRVNASSKRFGGFVSFLWHTLVSLVKYEPQRMRIRFGERPEVEGRYRSVVIANGRYFGGGMNIAPRAALDDGLFDVVVIPDVGLLESLRQTPSLYAERGVLHLDAVDWFRVDRVEARPGVDGEDVWVEMDGESPGKLPLTARILPGALPFRGPRPAPPPEEVGDTPAAR